MAKYTGGAMLVFGLGMLVVSMWCMKGADAGNDFGVDDDGVTIHPVRREYPPEGCGSHHTDEVEECTDEDDMFGLYSDVDDTFKAAIKKVTSHFHHHDDNDDSPDVVHNNVNVLGH